MLAVKGDALEVGALLKDREFQDWTAADCKLLKGSQRGQDLQADDRGVRDPEPLELRVASQRRQRGHLGVECHQVQELGEAGGRGEGGDLGASDVEGEELLAVVKGQNGLDRAVREADMSQCGNVEVRETRNLGEARVQGLETGQGHQGLKGG